jgi:DUF438 domain-containing protein
MINDNDIYSHLKNGGSIEDLKKAFDKEIAEVQTKIAKDKEKELKAKKQAEKIETSRKCALNALIDYCKAVGADYSEKNLGLLLSYLEKGRITFGSSALFDLLTW